MNDFTQKSILALIRLYRATAPLAFSFGGLIAYSGCRFPVTCSQYAEQVISQEGILRGGVLALRRIAQCHGLSKNPLS